MKKLTKNRLRQIIKEEARRILSEGNFTRDLKDALESQLGLRVKYTGDRANHPVPQGVKL